MKGHTAPGPPLPGESKSKCLKPRSVSLRKGGGCAPHVCLPVISVSVDMPDLEHPFPVLDIPGLFCGVTDTADLMLRKGKADKKNALLKMVQRTVLLRTHLTRRIPLLMQEHLSRAVACGWLEDLKAQSIDRGFTGLQKARLNPRFSDPSGVICVSGNSLRLSEKGRYLVGYGIETVFIDHGEGDPTPPPPTIPTDFGFLVVALFQSTTVCGKKSAHIVPDSLNAILPTRVTVESGTTTRVTFDNNLIQRLQATVVVSACKRNTRVGLVAAAFNNRIRQFVVEGRVTIVPPFNLVSFNGGMFATQLHADS